MEALYCVKDYLDPKGFQVFVRPVHKCGSIGASSIYPLVMVQKTAERLCKRMLPTMNSHSAASASKTTIRKSSLRGVLLVPAGGIWELTNQAEVCRRKVV